MGNEVRLIEITEEQLLAIKAMAYGCANNRRLVGASYMTGLSTENPQSIPFGKAWEIVQEFVDETLTIDPETLRPKGRWENYPSYLYRRCSVCKVEWEKQRCNIRANYYPNCGAKMEG